MNKIKYIKLPDKKFHKVYLTHHERKFRSKSQRESYLDQRNELIERIEEKLSNKFADESWEISGDINYHNEICGGIYNPALLSEKYIKAIVSAHTELGLSSWSYHTVCEFDSSYTEFLIRDGIVYIPESMPTGLRKALGYLEKSSVIDALGYVVIIGFGLAGSKLQFHTTAIIGTIILVIYIIFALTMNHFKHIYNSIGYMIAIGTLMHMIFIKQVDTTWLHYLLAITVTYYGIKEIKKAFTKKIILKPEKFLKKTLKKP